MKFFKRSYEAAEDEEENGGDDTEKSADFLVGRETSDDLPDQGEDGTGEYKERYEAESEPCLEAECDHGDEEDDDDLYGAYHGACDRGRELEEFRREGAYLVAEAGVAEAFFHGEGASHEDANKGYEGREDAWEEHFEYRE